MNVIDKKILLPIFPLNGAILFPNTSLPLNIFEKKYLEMIDYSLSQNKKIGMIQTDENNNFYKIGCIGKITSYEEALDGRYLINLLGEKYFTVSKEIVSEKKFRLAYAQIFKPDQKIKNSNIIDNKTKEDIIEKYFQYIQSSNQQIDINFLKTIKDESLVKFVAMSSPFTVPEKQMLLETYNLNELSLKLNTLLDYYFKNQNKKETLN